MNHGAGITKAMDNTREYAEAWIREYQEQHPEQKLHFKESPEVRQLSLFPL
jgi:predicted RNase H-like HicB family nuclease